MQNRISQAAAAIPLIGYLILFNDEIARFIEFDKITGGNGTLFLGSKVRLQLVYFGLVFFAVGLVWLRLRCPAEIAKFPDKSEYVGRTMLDQGVHDHVRLYLNLEEKFDFGKFDDVPYSREDLNEFIDRASPNALVQAENLSDDELWFQMHEVTNSVAAK